MESVSGNIKLNAQALDRLEGSTVSGDMSLQAALKPAGTIKAETLSGSLELILPKSTGAKLHVESFSGDIRSPSGQVEREEHGPGNWLDTRYEEAGTSGRTNIAELDLEVFAAHPLTGVGSARAHEFRSIRVRGSANRALTVMRGLELRSRWGGVAARRGRRSGRAGGP